MSKKDQSQHDFSASIHSAQNCQLNRRHFLQILAAGAGVVLLNGCSGADENSGNPIQAEAVGTEFKIAGAADLAPGKALAFLLPDATPGLVFKDANGALHAISAKCTHAGCTVLWQNSAELHCPCHGSRFALNGRVLEGPAKSPLPLFKVRAQGGDALITPAK